MLKIKLIVLLSILSLVAIVLNSSNNFSTSAKNDDVLQEIASYKTWMKINEKPIEVENKKTFIVDGQEVTNLNLDSFGWSFITDGVDLLPGSGRNKNQKDLAHYISKLGKGVKRLFNTSSKTGSLTKTEDKESLVKTEDEISTKSTTLTDLLKAKPDEQSHQFTFGEVYANDLARTEFEKDNPNFPVGSIIVREKNLTETSETPETVIAMVKREKGFSKDTDDWEFFVFEGKDLKMRSRETKGSCATCHSNAKKTDWVFREYLK